MANPNPSVKSNKSTTIAAIVGWAIIFTALTAGTGFYLGVQYQSRQEASKKAAVQDALKAVQTPTAVAEARGK